MLSRPFKPFAIFVRMCVTITNSGYYIYINDTFIFGCFIEFENIDGRIVYTFKSKFSLQILKPKIGALFFGQRMTPNDNQKIWKVEFEQS